MLWLDNEWFYKKKLCHIFVTANVNLSSKNSLALLNTFSFSLRLSLSLSLSLSLFVEKYRENNNKDLKDIQLIYLIIYNISNICNVFCLCSWTSFDTSNIECCLCCWISLGSSNIVHKIWSSRLDFFFFFMEHNPKIIKNLTKRMRVINTKILALFSWFTLLKKSGYAANSKSLPLDVRGDCWMSSILEMNQSCRLIKKKWYIYEFSGKYWWSWTSILTNHLYCKIT